MRWDATKRRYVDDNGNVMSEAEVRAEVSDYVDEQKELTEKDAAKLLAGTITVAAFFLAMRTRIRAWHDVAGTIAYGGKLQMNKERGARVATTVQSELKYLKNFQTEVSQSFNAARSLAITISEGLPLTTDQRLAVRAGLFNALTSASPSTAESVARSVVAEIDATATPFVQVNEALAQDLMGATIPSRASMYPDAAYATYENNVAQREGEAGMVGRRICAEDDASCEECVDAATDFFIDIDEIAGIGSLQCLNNCRCYIEYAEPRPGAQLTVEIDQAQVVEAVQ